MMSDIASSVATRQLNVFINDKHIGVVYENNGLWKFQYDHLWLERPEAYALAPYIPLQKDAHTDTGSYRPVQWFFDNLLPEEQARDLLAKNIKVSKEDAFGILEVVGSESAGAITLLPPGIELPAANLEPLSSEELSQRIRNLPREPMNRGERKRMSLAGAQHKMLVLLKDNLLYEPVGQTPSTHILKPERTDPELFYFTVRNEYTVMKLARTVGLQTPSVSIDYAPQAYYLVERFDRKGKYPNIERLHVLDGCQLLGLNAGTKYRKSTIETLQELQKLCRSKGLTGLRLFRWVLFNFLIGNSDAHLKNLSFIFNEGDIELAPHYDLLSTVIYAPIGEAENEPLSQPIGNAESFGQVKMQDLVNLANQFGLKVQIAEREISQMIERLRKAVAVEYQRLENTPSFSSKSGELRMLREIRFLAIEKHSQQVLETSK